jgi:hypothetical protein
MQCSPGVSILGPSSSFLAVLVINSDVDVWQSRGCVFQKLDAGYPATLNCESKLKLGIYLPSTYDDNTNGLRNKCCWEWLHVETVLPRNGRTDVMLCRVSTGNSPNRPMLRLTFLMSRQFYLMRAWVIFMLYDKVQNNTIAISV